MATGDPLNAKIGFSKQTSKHAQSRRTPPPNQNQNGPQQAASCW